MTFVSVILPIRNEEKFIKDTLLSVVRQTYAADQYEVLIVDGMSTDKTCDVISDLAQEYSHPNMIILDNPKMIVPTGLNIALRQAKGDIIIRVDGHCEIAPDFIDQCVKHLADCEVDAVGGPIETVGETYVAKVIARGMSSPFGVGRSAFRTIKDKTMLVDSVAFPAYTRKAIEKTGLLDEELVRNQDDEYNYRLRKLGGKILLTPKIRSRYFSRSSLQSLWRQYYQYGYWKIRVFQKHPAQMSFRQFVPPIFVATLIVTGLLAFFHLHAGIAFTSIASLYLLMSLAVSFWIARRKKWNYILLLPIVFAILHVSYGLGFLVGLFKFWNRWGDKKGKVPEF